MEPVKLAWTLLAMIALGLLAWAVETAVDRYRPNMGLISRFGIMLALALGIGFAAMKAAGAHDHNHPERNDWLKSLHANNKTWCCDGSDTDAIEDWEAKPSGYRVRFRGEWFDVPKGAVVDGPNTGGEALLWMNKGISGLSVRCFMPGTMS